MSISYLSLTVWVRDWTLRSPNHCLIFRSQDIFILLIPLLPASFPFMMSYKSWYLGFVLLCPRYAVFLFYDKNFLISIESSSFDTPRWNFKDFTVHPHFERFQFVYIVDFQCPIPHSITTHWSDLTFGKSYFKSRSTPEQVNTLWIRAFSIRHFVSVSDV